MKIVRLQKGQNDFAIGNLTLGKLNLIQRALTKLQETEPSPFVEEAKNDMDYFFKQNPKIDCFGSDNVGKIKPRQP